MVMESLYVDQDPLIAQQALNNQRVVRTLLLNFVVCLLTQLRQSRSKVLRYRGTRQICWTWSVVLAILALAHVSASQPSTVWVLLLFCLFSPLQAFLNLMVRVPFTSSI